MRTLFLGFVFFLCVACTLSADTVPFALYDVNGNSCFGRLLELTPEKIVLRTEDGEKKEFAAKEVAKLENLLRNPFASQDSAPERSMPSNTMNRWVSPMRSAIPMIQPPPGSRTVASLREKKEAETKADAEKSEFPSSLTVVELTDGSRLLATELNVNGKTATLRLFSEGELTQPLDRLVAVRLMVGDPTQIIAPPADWTKLLAKPSAKGDRLVVGTAGTLDAHEGILNEIGSETIRFTADGDTLPIPRRKVFGVIFHQPEPPKSNRPFCRLVCWNGTFLVLDSLELRAPHPNPLPEGEGTGNIPPGGEGIVGWKTLGGAEGTLRLEDIAEIVFETMGAVLLSKLTPDSVEQTLPFVWEKQEAVDTLPLALLQRFQANRLRQDGETPPLEILSRIVQRRIPGDIRSVKIVDLPIPDFQGIELDGTVYRQGLVVPAKTTLVFSLKEPFKAFTAKIGVDDRIRPNGQGRLTVLGDDLLLLDTVVYGDEPAQTIRLNIENCQKLTITVDFANGDAKAAVLSLAELKLEE